ncbi:DUF1569 domain-containing protein [Novipirellula sp.]
MTGQWSLAQILDHLNLSLQMTLTVAEFHPSNMGLFF